MAAAAAAAVQVRKVQVGRVVGALVQTLELLQQGLPILVVVVAVA